MAPDTPAHQHLVSGLQHLLSLGQFDSTNLIPMSRSEVDAPRKDECLQLMEQLGEAQPHRGELVIELKATIQSGKAPFLTGEEPPSHSGELTHALSQVGGPVPAMSPYVVRTPCLHGATTMEETSRVKH